MSERIKDYLIRQGIPRKIKGFVIDDLRTWVPSFSFKTFNLQVFTSVLLGNSMGRHWEIGNLNFPGNCREQKRGLRSAWDRGIMRNSPGNSLDKEYRGLQLVSLNKKSPRNSLENDWWNKRPLGENVISAACTSTDSPATSQFAVVRPQPSVFLGWGRGFMHMPKSLHGIGLGHSLQSGYEKYSGALQRWV